MTDLPDILVVGNGALGLSVSKALAEAGMSVALVGEAERPGGASAAAGAMLGCFAEVTKDTLRTKAGRSKFALGLRAHALWPELLDEFADEATAAGEVLQVVGATDVVLNGRGGVLDSENFDAVKEALRQHQMTWSEISPDQIEGYRPPPDGRALQALRIEGEGAVDSRQVLRLMERRARRSGVMFHDQTVESLVLRGDRVIGVRLLNGEVLKAGMVLVAAGSRSGELVRSVVPVGTVQPMLSGVGVAMVARRAHGTGFTNVVRTPNRGGACGLHLVPLGDGLEYIGATNSVSHVPMTTGTVGTTGAILDQYMRQLDESAATHTIDHWRIGNRPVALDGYPLIGGLGIDGLYLLTGTYRDGFHAAPALAEDVTAEIVEGAARIDRIFAPDRAPLESWTVEASIEEYALHMVSLWFELGGRGPGQISTDAMFESHRATARAFYERAGIDLALAPDVLAHLIGTQNLGVLTELLRYLRQRPGSTVSAEAIAR